MSVPNRSKPASIRHSRCPITTSKHADQTQQHQPIQNQRPHNRNRLHPRPSPSTHRLLQTPHQPRPKLHPLPSPLALRHQKRRSHKRHICFATHSTRRKSRARAMDLPSAAIREMDNAYARSRHRPLRATARKLLPW